LQIAIKESCYLTYTFHTINFEFVYNGCFACILFWQDKAFEAFFSCLYCYWQGTFYRLQTSVERKFSHNNVFIQVFINYLTRAGKYPKGYRKIICRAFFSDICRGHVDDYFLPGHTEIIGLQSGFNTLHRFAHGVIGQTNNQIERFGTATYIYFDGYGNRLDTIHRAPESFD